MLTSYDVIADWYDVDMGPSAPDADVAFYVERAREGCGTALELGCGTGRITLPLARVLPVVGLDRSRGMLAVLRAKAARDPFAEGRPRLRLVRAAMERIALSHHFRTILCPYSALTYLVELESLRSTLARVRSLLEDGGRFLLDVFVPDPEVAEAARRGTIFDYRRRLPDGTWLERCKRIELDVEPGLNEIVREYRHAAEDGRTLETRLTRERIRPHRPEALYEELERSSFRVEEVWGDFHENALEPSSRVAVFVCRASS